MMKNKGFLFIVLAALTTIQSCKSHRFSEVEGVPSDNPATILQTDAQKATAATLRDIKEGHLYTMENTADYKLNEIMDQGGAKSSEDLIMKVFQNLLNLPVSASDSKMDYGCSAFCVKSPEGDVIVGRNFDYRFVSSANVAVHNICSSAFFRCVAAVQFSTIPASPI